MAATEEFTATAGKVAATSALAPSQLSGEDEAAFMRELQESEMTEAQARELLGILVWMMGFFVEHGFSGDICGSILQAVGFENREAADAAMITASSQIDVGGPGEEASNEF